MVKLRINFFLIIPIIMIRIHLFSFFLIFVLFSTLALAIEKYPELNDDAIFLEPHLFIRGDKIDCSLPANFELVECGYCDDDADCNGHGICDDNLCSCEDEYAGDFCNRKRKSKLVAFLLTLLVGPIFSLPVGAGRFYLGYIGIGVGQILLSVTILILIIPIIVAVVLAILGGMASRASASAGSESNSTPNQWLYWTGCCCCTTFTAAHVILVICYVLIAIGSLFAIGGWWLSDWIRILTGDLKDADGYELYNDM